MIVLSMKVVYTFFAIKLLCNNYKENSLVKCLIRMFHSYTEKNINCLISNSKELLEDILTLINSLKRSQTTML